METGIISLIILAVLIIIAVSVFLRFVPLGLWITALFSGVKNNIGTLFNMRFRRVTPHHIIHPLIKAIRSGLDLSAVQLEAHYLAGGNVDDVIDALIASQRADIDLEFEKAAAIDLAGRNVFEA